MRSNKLNTVLSSKNSNFPALASFNAVVRSSSALADIVLCGLASAAAGGGGGGGGGVELDLVVLLPLNTLESVAGRCC